MDTLIDQYLDGSLTNEEARSFLDAVASDPRLEAELRSYEAMLALGASHAPGTLSNDLTDRVMERVHGATIRNVPSSRPAGMRAWTRHLARAAGFVVIFGLGYVGARLGVERDTNPVPATLETTSQASSVAQDRTASFERDHELRFVRLVYVPENPDVTDVTIAGSFNAWNPTTTPMQRRGNVFISQIVLPPDTYEYMFVENGENWVIDPLAYQTRDDGFGRENAVLDLTL